MSVPVPFDLSDGSTYPHRFRLGQGQEATGRDSAVPRTRADGVGGGPTGDDEAGGASTGHGSTEGEEVLAVAIRTTSGRINYFLTLGKPFHHKPLGEIARWTLQRCCSYDLDGIPEEAEVCYSLQDARDEPWFFEKYALLLSTLAAARSEADRLRLAEEVKHGEHFHYLGSARRRSRLRPHYWSMKLED